MEGLGRDHGCKGGPRRGGSGSGQAPEMCSPTKIAQYCISWGVGR